MHGRFRTHHIQKGLQPCPQPVVIIFRDSVFGNAEFDFAQIYDSVRPRYEHVHLGAVMTVIALVYP